jgi:hypothetical protein
MLSDIGTFIMVENFDTFVVKFQSHSLWLYTTWHRVLLYVYIKISEEILPPYSGFFLKTSVPIYKTIVSKPTRSQKNHRRENLESYNSELWLSEAKSCSKIQKFPHFYSVPASATYTKHWITFVKCFSWDRDSSVSIVTGYGLDRRDSVPCRGDFSLPQSVYTGSGAHPAAYPMRTAVV